MTWDVRRVLYSSIGALFLIQLVAAVSAVGLLARMAPAVERIASENVASLHQVEEMALAFGAGDAGAGGRFEAALAAAGANVTEDAERAPLGALEREWRAGLAGEPVPRARTIEALSALGAANRAALERRYVEAKRLGAAGAWAVVALALAGAIAAALVLRRLERQILTPLRRLGEVAAGIRRGERHRRCHAADGVAEVREAMRVLDELLDEREASADAGQRGKSDRALLLGLLDAQPQAAAVLDGSGELLAANRRMLDLLGSAAGEQLARALREAPGGVSGSELEARPIAGEGCRWVTIVDEQAAAERWRPPAGSPRIAP